MPRPQKFRQLVTKYCTIASYRRRMVRESIEVPPPLPPKDFGAVHSPYRDPSLGSYIFLSDCSDEAYLYRSIVDMQRDYAAHVVFLAQIDHEASHALYPERSYDNIRAVQPRASPSHPIPPLPTSIVMPRMLSAQELRRRRMTASKTHAVEAQDAEREELERQVRLKREKEAFLRELEEDEQQRKLILERELKHAAIVQKLKEDAERREEEEKHRELEARRSSDRARRLQQTEKLQEWRHERARQAEEAARRKIEMRRTVEAERRARPVPRAQTPDPKHADSFDGWVTMQTADSLTWKRRFCRVRGTAMQAYKDSVSLLPNTLLLYAEDGVITACRRAVDRDRSHMRVKA